MNAPTEFYTVSAYSDRSGAWEHMMDRFADRADAVQIVSDYSDTYAQWMVVRIDLDTGTAKDVTDAICNEAADNSADFSCYEAQRREAKISGHFA